MINTITTQQAKEITKENKEKLWDFKDSLSNQPVSNKPQNYGTKFHKVSDSLPSNSDMLEYLLAKSTNNTITFSGGNYLIGNLTAGKFVESFKSTVLSDALWMAVKSTLSK